MKNPFENGHIKNYLLAYVSVVVIMILFFIASTLFHDVKIQDKKTFESTDIVPHDIKVSQDTNQSSKKKFKLLPKGY